jgi:hypothetical protein
MTLTLVQVADGDWTAVGSGEEYGIASIISRWRRALRKLMTIILPFIAAFAAWHFFAKYSIPYATSAVLTCVAFSGIQILSLIEPDAAARLDIAMKVSDKFNRG